MVANTIRSRKSKGRRLQQYVRDILRKSYVGINIYTNTAGTSIILKDRDIESRQMSGAGTDLVLSPAAELIIPFDIECKNVENLNIWSALEQAQTNTKEGRTSLVVFKRNKSEVYCALKLDDLLKLIR